jgi:hypothetical protein
MTPRFFRIAAALGLILGTGALAHADWPVARHDSHRTGEASGTSDLRTPAPYWRHYLGGALGPSMATPIGTEDVGYIGGGRLRVLSVDGLPRWTSDNLALTQLVAVADLNLDGNSEVVARSFDRVFILDAATGTLRWAEPIGEMGTLGDVRVDDADQIAGPELTVQECACCQLRSPTPGVVYSFVDGWDFPRRLWTLPSSACAGSRQMTFTDATGTGGREFVLSTFTDIRLLDARSGALLAASPDLGIWASASYCEPADVLPGGSRELVCWQGTPLATGHGHRVFVLAYRDSPARLVVAWSTVIGDQDTEMVYGAQRIGDLDHDGSLEIIATGTAAGAPVTTVLDGATGEILGSIAAQQQVGILNPTATDSLLLTEADQQLVGWRFDRRATPRLTLQWRLKDRRALITRDPALGGKTALATGLVMFDQNHDGVLDLATVDTRRPNVLLVYDSRNPADITLGTWRAAANAEVLTGWLSDDRLTVSTSDGRVTSLALPTLASLGSFRGGQYYDNGGWLHLPQAPVAAQLSGDAAAEVVVTDSRRSLSALSAATATNANPPTVLWELRSANAPAMSPALGAGATPGLACRRLDTNTVPATEKLARVDSNGSVRWEVPLAGTVWNDPVLGNFDGDLIPDMAVQWGLSSDNAVRTTAFAGSDGHELWTNVTTAGDARFPSGFAVADWNHDGTDDVVFHHFGTYVLSGSNGSVVATSGAAPTSYFMPTVFDANGDGQDEVLLSGGFSAARTLDHSLTTTRWLGADDRPYPYGALVRCGTTRKSITASLANAGMVTVVEQGNGSGQTTSSVLAGGQLFANAAAAELAGAQPGQLTSIVVHDNLTGLGHPSAVVGSSDGWLYAFNPCALGLDFAVPFGAPVGAAAFADTDDDGNDELVVSVADGYLYGLKNAPITGPSEVRDLEPGTSTGPDVDEVTTRDTLSAEWQPVAGAANYEVAFAHADGGYLTNPAWHAVTGTTYTASGLDLVDGQTYVAAVRVRATGGFSPDILSDGVIVHRIGPPNIDAGPADAGGADAGGHSDLNCGCCSTSSRPHTGLLLSGLVAALLVRRRRRP